MSTKGDGEGTSRGHIDLYATVPDERSLPAVDPVALEELQATLAALAQEMAELRRTVQARQTEPVGQQALDAWGEKIVNQTTAAASVQPPESEVTTGDRDA